MLGKTNWRIATGLTFTTLVLAALIAFTNFDKFRFHADESSAVGSLRTLYSSNSAYAKSHPQQGYPNKLADLSRPSDKWRGEDEPEWVIDPALAAGTRFGYAIAYHPRRSAHNGKIDAYEITADPVQPSEHDKHHFFMNETGTIRMSETGPANVS